MAPSRSAIFVALLAVSAATDGRPIPEIPPKVRHPRKDLLVRHHPMYGRTLSMDDWPFLSDAISRSRSLPLGNRIACLMEGEEDIRDKELAFWDLGGDVYQLTFLTQRPDALYFPNSLLADGRNFLYAAAAMWELQLGQRYLYYIIMDADAEAKNWTTNWRGFQDFLFDWQPAVGLPMVWQFEQILKDYKSNDEGIRSVHHFDHQVLAVHSDASVWLLPYDTKNDSECQWVSQWRFSSLACALFPEHVLLTDQVSVGNPHHSKYSKKRCIDLFGNTTEELRGTVAPEFRSCFINPSYQVIVLDGMPRLTAYVPWFSPLKRDQNYSRWPQLKSCEDQAVVQAWRRSEREDADSSSTKYSWCRGCDTSVAFAVLQSIVAMRPLSFSGWVKLANLLAVSAARKDDLMAALVAFTVASRLIWCDQGVKGSLMDAQELKDFYAGAEEHGIFLERTAESLNHIEEYILSLDAGVLYNGIRAALSPFEGQSNRIQPPIISEENVELLVKIVRECDEPGSHSMLMKQNK